MPTFTLNNQFQNLEPNLPKKGISGLNQKTKKNTTMEFYIFELFLVPDFSLNRKLKPNFPKKGISRQKNVKSELHHWILHIHITLSNKFQLKLTILSFWTKYTQKRYFRSKAKEVSISIEFCISELGQVPNFSLNWRFWFFGPNLPKESISSLKQKSNTTVEFWVF